MIGASASSADVSRRGLSFALAAYSIWGFAPIYFVWVGFAHPLEILSHRVLWSVPFVALLLTISGQWQTLRALTQAELRTLFLTALCLGANWLTFIYAIQANRLAEATLGYFINPLVNVFLGWLFLRERMRRWQWLAVVIAAAGVALEIWAQSQVPLLPLMLAFSFGFYGLLRKRVNVPSVLGLGIETSLMLPFALCFLVVIGVEHGTRPSSELSQLAMGGVVSVVPLICFASAAARLRLTTLGFVQYLAPTISLLLAIYLFDEVVPSLRWITYSLIWAAMIIFSAEGILHPRLSNKGK